ncbi:hypothetical protein P9112_005560 [Eukaryota sp. TZLM1-RC]
MSPPLKKFKIEDPELQQLLNEHEQMLSEQQQHMAFQPPLHVEPPISTSPPIDSSLLNSMVESLRRMEKSFLKQVTSLNIKMDNILKRYPASHSADPTTTTTTTTSTISTRSKNTTNKTIKEASPPPESSKQRVVKDKKPSRRPSPQPEHEATATTTTDTDIRSLPRHLIFKAYLPPQWFFLSYADLAFSCLRFYDSPITVDFLYEAVKHVPLINRATMTPKPCCELTPSWQHCINQTLDHNSNIVRKKGKHLSLTPYGLEAFTSIGVNFGTEEGQAFMNSCRRMKKSEYPSRNLPSDFEFLTVYDVLNPETSSQHSEDQTSSRATPEFVMHGRPSVKKEAPELNQPDAFLSDNLEPISKVSVDEISKRFRQ